MVSSYGKVKNDFEEEIVCNKKITEECVDL